jgi:hypothetical protein
LLLLAALTLLFAPSPSHAQLPDAPSTATISGTVKDIGKTVLSGAHVIITTGAAKEETVTDEQGHFSLTGIAPGSFTLTIAEESFMPETLTGTLRPGESFDVPPIFLRIATAKTEINVSYTQEELGEQEVKAEERQRLLGVVPNFFISYNPHPVPLTAKQKFKLALRGSTDPYTYIGTGVAAAIQYANNDLPGYGPGFSGYAKRYGADYTNSASATLLRGAVFPSLLHQDPRFFYKADGTVTHRALYAISTAFICKGDNGKWQPNYSDLLANLSAGALVNLYYPVGSRNGASTTVENALISTASVGIGHLMQEFLYNHLTTHRHPHPPPLSAAPQPEQQPVPTQP